MTINNESLEFQLYDWSEDLYITNNESENNEDNIGKYIIHCFGRCENGKSVYAKIIKFEPYFYI